MSQKLRGFVGQSMRGQKANKLQTEPYSFPPAVSAYSFMAPKAGYWKFVAWGPGGAQAVSTSAGGSGAYGEITKFLPFNSVTTIQVQNNTDTVLTFPDASVATAGKASTTTAGAASGFDYSLAGSAGVLDGANDGNAGSGTGGGTGGPHSGTSAGGAGAPGRLPYRGGNGGSGAGGISGVGAGAGEGSANTQGQGMVLAVFMRA